MSPPQGGRQVTLCGPIWHANSRSDEACCKLAYPAVTSLTVHLSLVGEDDFAAAARRIDGERFLEALLDVGAPDALGVVRQVVAVARHVAVVVGEAAHPPQRAAAARVAARVAAVVHSKAGRRWLRIAAAVVPAERLPSRAPVRNYTTQVGQLRVRANVLCTKVDAQCAQRTTVDESIYGTTP